MSSNEPEPSPDYPLDDHVEASTPKQLKAIGHPTRYRMLDLVLERAATTSELAESLGIPKGTAGYHVKVLEAAGLVQVVATRKVRALTTKYYGRVGRTILVKGDHLGANSPAPMLTEAMLEATSAVEAGLWRDDDPSLAFTLRHARLTKEQAASFADRLVELAVEFTSLPRGGDTVYGLILGVYPTDHPMLKSQDEER